jgi:hypothetical protein
LPKLYKLDAAAIVRMHELITGDPPMKVRTAAHQVVRELGYEGRLETHEERLRRRYRNLRDRKELPSGSGIDATRRFVRQAYAAREEDRARVAKELAAKEQEANALGIDISEPDLSALLQRLDQERSKLQFFLYGGAEVTAGLMIAKHRLPEEADAEIVSSAAQFQALKKELKLVEEIRRLRDFAVALGQ